MSEEFKKIGRNSLILMSELSEEIKCVFLGDSGVGKTCILNYFINGTAARESSPTIGAAYVSKSITVDGKLCDLMIWDTAGQEMYRGLAPMYYRNARAAFLVYDITSKKSFEAVSYWATELANNSGSGDGITIMVVGNKVDFEERREVPTDDAQNVADSLNAKFVETSAVTGVNIERLFQTATSEVLKKKTKVNQSQPDPMDVNHELQKKKGCC